MSIAAAAPAAEGRGLAFGALRHPDFRFYVTGATLSMMADNIEHVITYWVLWQSFHSPMLAGFAVISHWVPYLLFSVYFGYLAERFDCRRVIQASQALFMGVSITWGILFLTGQLQMWHAMVLLILHGFAGALWSPAEQLMLHDIAGKDDLESAVRLNATGRQLGILLGPAVGGVLLLVAGTSTGIFLNALIYLPLSVSLLRTKSNGHAHGAIARKTSIGQAWSALGQASGNRAIIAMIAMAGVSAFLIGSFTPQMPEFARDLTSNASLAYTGLLLAGGGGAVFGGLLLEITGLARPSVRSAIVFCALWGLSTAAFAATGNFVASLICLFIAGVTQLAFNTVAQTIVQLQAPAALRGQLIGAFLMAQLGLKTGSGISVGVVGNAIGIHPALGLSATLTVVLAIALFLFSKPSMQPAYETVEVDSADWTPPNSCC